MSSPGDPSDVTGVDPDMSGTPASDQRPQPTGRRNAHLRKSVADMVRSMALVLGVVFVIVLLAWRPLPDAVKVVDTAPAIGMAEEQADYPIVVPVNLPEEWRPTSARWQPTEKSRDVPVLHIGYVTPTDAYAQVSTAAVASEGYLDEQTAQGSPTGTREVGGEVWQVWENDERRSLVLTDGEVSVVVSGTGEWPEIDALATSLDRFSR